SSNMIQSDRSLLLAVPVTASNTTLGYLVGRWVPDFSAWVNVRPIEPYGNLLITDLAGRAVSDKIDASLADIRLGTDFEPIKRAKKKPTGMLTLFEPFVRKRTLVGYSVANQVGLIAMVLMPTETALASSR